MGERVGIEEWESVKSGGVERIGVVGTYSV